MKKYLNLILSCLFITNLYSSSDNTNIVIHDDQFKQYIDYLFKANLPENKLHEKFDELIKFMSKLSDTQLTFVLHVILFRNNITCKSDFIKYLYSKTDSSYILLRSRCYACISNSNGFKFRPITNSKVAPDVSTYLYLKELFALKDDLFKDQMTAILTDPKASIYRDSLLLAAAVNDEYDIIEYFLSKSDFFDVNVISYYDDTPLKLACINGNTAIAETLLKNKSNVKPTGLGLLNDPVYIACYKGNFALLKLLVNYGAKCNTDHLRSAVIRGDIIMAAYIITILPTYRGILLIDQNILIDACKTKNLALIKYLIEASGININYNQIDLEYGDTALHKACKTGNLGIVEYLVNTGNFNINQYNKTGYNPLSLACIYGHLDVVKFLADLKDIDLNAINANGDTILHLACRRPYLDIIEFLVNVKNFDINAKNHNDATTIKIACDVYNEPRYKGDALECRSRELYEEERNTITFLLKKLAIISPNIKLQLNACVTEENRVKDIILNGSLEQLKTLKTYNLISLFNHNQMAEFIVQKLKAIKFDETTTKELITMIRLYNLNKLFYQNNHILWHSLSRYKVTRNISRLLIELCPKILEFVPNNMYQVDAVASELCEILKENQNNKS